VTGPYRNGEHLVASSRLWPDRKTGPWLLTFHWQAIDGRPECVGLDIASSLPERTIEERAAGWAQLPEVGQPLRTGVLRDLRLSELIQEERVRAEHLRRDVFETLDAGSAYAPAKNARPATVRRMEMAAAAYREAWAVGGQPVRAVALRLGITQNAAKNLVARARAAGMLPPTSAGVPAGE
jgi:hypothetical protein